MQLNLNGKETSEVVSANPLSPEIPLDLNPALREDDDPTHTEASTSDAHWATRVDATKKPALSKNGLILMGGGLLAAVLLFVVTAFIGKSSSKQRFSAPAGHPAAQSAPPKGSVTPVMDTVREASPSNASGELSPADINRTKMNSPTASAKPLAAPSAAPQKTIASTLGGVPSFTDTQQRWEEPKPYGELQTAASPQAQQQQNLLKEASLVFVRNQVKTAVASGQQGDTESDSPVLDLTPGTRIQAKLETQISSAVQTPVVAVVEYTYALGDRVVIPAGTRVYGQLQQADRSGAVGIKFDELELLDGSWEKISAIGTSLDLGPIKGTVSGKNTGRNFLVRAASGIGSVAAMIIGNNTSESFSEDDLIRERIAENVGTAGDTELTNMAVTNRIVVSVPADTKIYVVFTKRESPPTTLHQLNSSGQ